MNLKFQKRQIVPLVFLFVSLSNFNPICAQSIDSFGKTIQEIRNMHTVDPCEFCSNFDLSVYLSGMYRVLLEIDGEIVDGEHLILNN